MESEARNKLIERRRNATRIAGAFQGGRWLKGYIRGKLLRDPVFETALESVRGSECRVVDLGAGLGLLGLWLRIHGETMPYSGCDLGSWKIREGNRVAEVFGFRDFCLHEGDLTTFPLESDTGIICAFDILHYLPPDIQEALLRRLAAAARLGTLILIRNGVSGCGWRSATTLFEEWWTRVSGWINGGTINFPTLAGLVSVFESEGCSVQTKPLWGKTPFSSYWITVSAR